MGGLIAADKFDGEPIIVQPYDPASALDIFMAGSKRDTDRNDIALVKLVHVICFNMSAAQADISYGPSVNASRMRKYDLSIVSLSLIGPSELTAIYKKFFSHL
jgi:hypothetical protein